MPAHTLKWDAVVGAVSYKINIRTEIEQLPTIFNVTDVQYDLTDFTNTHSGNTLFFTVAAYDQYGQDGFVSNEISWTVFLPAPQNLRIE